ncbi:alpha amylase C-terminal domain-containing protein [Aeromicrobium camelliae]|nr:alpha amylase C-terminal domain-containing protein [Aeromicrobium camelliae]
MGGEFGQEREWTESGSLSWDELDDPLHAGVQHVVRDLNRLYRSTPALYTQDSFRWIDASDTAGNVICFLRIGADGSQLACLANFSGAPHHDYRVGLPVEGTWREVLNTDAQLYGGSGVGNLGAVHAEGVPWHGLPASAEVQLPPAGVLWLVPED